MDSTTIIQVVSGVLFALVVVILIQRRRMMVKSPAAGAQSSGQDSGIQYPAR